MTRSKLIVLGLKANISLGKAAAELEADHNKLGNGLRISIVNSI